MRLGTTDRIERSLVWMLGPPRSGSTWLLNLLAGHPRVRAWDEPLIGAHLGVTFEAVLGVGLGEGAPPTRVNDWPEHRDSYVLSPATTAAWRPPLRELLLRRAAVEAARDGRFPRGGRLVIKEPHGSIAADLLVGLTPRSRQIVLVRDPRDVVDSSLDAVRPGAWGSSSLVIERSDHARRERFVVAQAHLWVMAIDAARRAAPRSVTVRYEDALADTATTLTTLYEHLGVEPVDTHAIAEAGTFDSIPPELRGPGRFARAARPGLWRENLSDGEVTAILDVAGPLMHELGYATDR